MVLFNRLILVVCLLACGSALGLAQESAPAVPAVPAVSDSADVKPGQLPPPPDKRLFGVLPNYRTANETAIYTPITTKRKFIIGAKDSFDYPLVLLAGAIAGLGQLTNENPSFGQGMAGYGRRVGTSYADQAIGNMMTEAFFPSFLHEDPRYFRRGSGSKGSRAVYALTRVFVTRTDSGGRRFNFSEVLGNAVSVGISNSYDVDNRTVGHNVLKLGEQIGTDAASQVLKEFWPDIKRKLFKRKAN